MLGETRLARKTGDVSHGYDEMIVFELKGPRSKPCTRCHSLVFQVDRLDFAGVEVCLRAQPPDGCDGINNSNAARNHLWQHGLKHLSVLFAAGPHLISRLTAKELLKYLRRVGTTEAPAD